MGNAYNNASLLVTPNGYKASKIYSAKPTDGTGDLAFSRASTAMRRNSAGLWESVANNVPRLQYPVGGGCPSWLFEAQATNIFTDNTTYLTPTFIDATLNSVNNISPAAANTAGLFYEDAVTSFDHYFALSLGPVSGNYTYSLYVKGEGRDYCQLAIVDNSTPYRPIFKLSDNTVVNNGGLTCTITAAANGYSYITVSKTMVSLTQVTLIAQDSATYQSYLGDVTKGLYFWGAQIESGSVATSPIITAGSAVTRLADLTTSPDISSLLGSYLSVATSFERTFIGRGTLFELNENNAGDNIVRVDLESGGNIFITVVKSGVVVVNSIIGTYTINTYSKVALIYDGTYKFFINGTLTYTSALLDLPENLDRIHYGQVRSASGYHLNGITDLLDITPAALSNTEAEELTTL
jgi:hypothetical protein